MLTELRTAVRRLLRSPFFSLAAVGTLAVGIGASAAVFSVIHAVLIRPLPYPEPESLVGVWHSDPAHDRWPHAHVSYLFYRAHNHVFEDMGLYLSGEAGLTGGDQPEQLPSVEVTPSLLRVLGIAPSLGRGFRDEDSEPAADPTVILGHSLWQRRFGGDPGVVGSRIWVDGVARTVLGVMPAGFRVATVNAELFLPMAIDRLNPERGLWGNVCIARLRPDTSQEMAQREMNALTGRVHEAFPDPEATRQAFEKANIGAKVTSLRDDVVGGVARVLWILFGCVGAVLAIAIANVANLFMVRAEGRQQETAVRAALGAGRGAIARGTVLESLIVALAGGAGGLVLATVGIHVLSAVAPTKIPRLDDSGVGIPVVVFTAAVAILCGLVFGLVSAVRRVDDPSSALQDGGRSSTSGRPRHRIRSLLVVFQLALALVLMVLSGLMIRSFAALLATDLGCDPTDVIAMRLAIPASEYPGPAESLAFYREVLERVSSLPGVESAGMITGVPLDSGGILLGHSIEDSPMEEDDIEPNYVTHLVVPGALDALGVPMVAGRRLDADDLGGGTRTAMISEALARRFWQDPGSAVGRRIMPGSPRGGGTWYTIVGVVGDVPYEGLADGLVDAVYYPFWSLRVNTRDRMYTNQLELVIETSVSGASVVQPVVDQVWEVDPDVPVAAIRTMEEVVAVATARTRFTMTLLLVAACVALVLASVGLYGVISHVVSLRTREIGIRMALGADPEHIHRMVLGQGLVIAVAGVGLGLVGSILSGRVVASQLYGVTPTDPLTYAAVSVALVGLAMFASYLPARRAATMRPLDALRYE
jgi:predicted permease